MNQQQLLNESIRIFDTQEKWEALFEIYSKSDKIMDQWQELGAKSLRSEYTDAPDGEWVVEEWGSTRDSRWFLKGLGSNSLGIGFGWPEWEFHLHFHHYHIGSMERVIELLNESTFRPLLAFFPDRTSRGQGCIMADTKFNPYSGSIDPASRRRKLAWKAAHETPEFVSGMLAHVRQILQNPELTQLIRKLNERLNSDTSRPT